MLQNHRASPSVLLKDPMNIQLAPQLARRSRLFTQVASIAVIMLGSLVLTGWQLQFEGFKSILSSLLSMAPNTAVGMVVCGAALNLLSQERAKKAFRFLATVLAMVVIALGLLVLSEYFFGWDLRLDHWLSRREAVPSQLVQMSPTAALCFILIGGAVFTASRRTSMPLKLPLVAALGAAVMVIGALALIGHVFEAVSGSRSWNYTGMAVHTAAGFLLLGSTTLGLARSRATFGWSLNATTTGGFLLGIVLMVAVAAVSYNLTRQLQRTAILVGHTQQMLTEIEEVEVSMLDMEAGQHSYIITGDETLLEERGALETDVQERLDKLRELSSDNPNQRGRRNRIQSLIAQRIRWGDETLLARRRSGFSAAQERVSAGTGRALLEECNRIFKEMEDDEHALLAKRQKYSETASQMTFLLLPLGVVLSLAGLSLGLFFLNAGMGERKQAEHSLRQSEEGMRAILDSALDCIITMDHHGRVVVFNPAAEKTFGYPREKAIGQLLSELIIPPLLRERHQKGLSRYLAIGETQVLGKRLEMTAMRSDGSEFPAELAITRIGSQEPPMFTGFIRDITERRFSDEAIRASEQRFSSFMDNVPGFAWMKDAEGRYVYGNKFFQELLIAGEWRGRTVEEVWPPEIAAPLRTNDEKVIETKAPLQTVEMIVQAGEKRAVLSSKFPILNANGEVAFICGIGIDITERKRGEEALRQAEEKYRGIFENAVEGIFQTTPGGRYISVNPALARVYGYGSPEELMATVSDIGHLVYVNPERRTEFKRLIEAQGFVERFEYEVYCKDGSTVWLSENARAVRDASGAVIYYEGAVQDITERKRGEDALRASEERYRRLFESNPNPMWVYDHETLSFLAVNAAAIRHYGYSQDEFLAMTIKDIRPSKDIPGLMDDLSQGTDDVNNSTQWRHCTKDGTLIDVEIASHELNWLGRRAKLVLINDITERKRAEKTLREQAALFNQTYDAVLVWDWKGPITFWNRGAENLYGYTDIEAVGSTPRQLLNTQVAGGLQTFIQSLDGHGVWEGEVGHTTRDGRQITVESRMVLVREPKREYVLEINRDISQRKRTEERLFEQADIINRAHDAIIILNFEDQRITFWNSGAERLYGWSADDAIGKSICELIFADAKDCERPLKLLASDGEFHGETKQVARDGREIIVDTRATLIRHADGTPPASLLINTDVTEQKNLETHLLRAQRLESIGTLASGVAHDLNNILTPILICAEVLKGNPAAEDIPPTISLIEESARRGAAVVKQVLTFARGIEGERVTIKPSHLIEEMLDIARKTFPKSIEITSRYPEDLATIECDPTQLHQVMLNLSVNARDAMPNGGRLTITADNFDVDEHYASMTPGAKTGPHVMLRVSDTGTGMPQANIDKIFDPFFTTKEVGKGTGLGLSTALGIIKSHGGFISVDTEVGIGTTFKVFLPAKVSEETLQKSRVPSKLLEGNGELILVVDDEPGILRASKMILEKQNYRVLTANDGPEALALIAQQKDAIRLVLSDISMPYMDGVMLIRAIKKMKPDTAILASTGQGEQGRMAELQSLSVNNFLAKPYNTEKLLLGLRNALEGRVGDSSPISGKTLDQLAAL